MGKRWHDENQINLDWWNELTPLYKSLLFWIEKLHETSGIYKVNLGKFCRDYWHGEYQPKDIDLKDFCNQCNIDGKERMMLIDDGRRLFYTPTIKFQQTKKSQKITRLVSSFCHVGIVQQLSAYKETRDWALKKVKKGDLVFDIKLLNHCISTSDKESGIIEFCFQIKKASNMDVKVNPEKAIKCGYCQSAVPESSIQTDHIVPISNGGDDYQDNRIKACPNCNNSKNNGDLFQFVLKNSLRLDKDSEIVAKVKKLLKRKKIHLPSNYPNDYPSNYINYWNSLLGIGTGIGNGQGINTSNITTFNKDSNKPPISPLERPEDLKEFIKHYKKNSGHNDLLKYWSGMNKEEKEKALSAAKKLTTDIQFRKDPFYYLRDKDFELPTENKPVYIPPKTSGKDHSLVDYEKAKERYAKKALERKQKESSSTNSLGG